MPGTTQSHKKVKAGLPLWVMTFADLMTLLMCFFVLILSFSELDILKYKQLAGSMAHAFGVQREIEARVPPKGINIIAREFSPGQPMPTPLNVVRQKTTADLRIHLEVGGHKTRPTPAQRSGDLDPKEQTTRPEQPPEPLTRQEIEQTREELRQREAALREREERQDARLDDATAEEILAAREERERQRQLEENARRLMTELEQQIREGAVDVEREGQKIIIRIREKASFASGSAEVVAKFRPVLWRLGEIIETMEGRIIVAGHTDNIPIHTPRFRSNWELSSGRAVSVVHELLWQTAIPLERFLVQGHGETVPVAPNDTPANRAQNRRVEIILSQGDDQESRQEISRQGVQERARETVIPEPVEEVEESLPQTADGPAAETGAAVPVPEVEEPGAPAAAPESTAVGEADAMMAPAAAEEPVPDTPLSGISTGGIERTDPASGPASGVSAGIVRPPARANQEQEAP